MNIFKRYAMKKRVSSMKEITFLTSTRGTVRIP